jgi:hypothetical protein
MDLLVDPVGLHATGQLGREIDGYAFSYRVTTT